MDLKKIAELITNALEEYQPIKIIFSQPKKGNEFKRRVLTIKNQGFFFWQEEAFFGNQVFHKNFKKKEEVEAWFEQHKEQYVQALIRIEETDYQLLLGQKRTKIRVQTAPKEAKIESHNRKKNYIFAEGIPHDFLVELKVMNKAGKVYAAKYDKFRQINRYLEIVADVLQYLPKKSLKIIDFGSGKAYLTFALYKYLTEQGYEPDVLGLDLKEDVVSFCQKTAEKLNYHNLKFALGDIADWQSQGKIDLVISLHACDTATDAALAKAIEWDARVILAAPCCQHELMDKIKSEEQKAFLRHGILKERLAALITDALRGELLEVFGYKTDIMEFQEFQV